MTTSKELAAATTVEALVASLSPLIDFGKLEEFRAFAEETATLMVLAASADRPDLARTHVLQLRARVESERLIVHAHKWEYVDGVLEGVLSAVLRLAPLVF